MLYISTRGHEKELSFTEAVTTGTAPDGGLYIPKELPKFTIHQINRWRNLSYTDLAFEVMYPFTGGTIPEDDFRKIVEKSYARFRHEDVIPTVQISERLAIMELFHGPTLAFKDVALQFLGNLLDYILKREDRKLTIIGATSGDTGSAAIEGCLGCDNITVFMMHPKGRVSDVQRKQMTTIMADNIHNLAIDGVFDDCQNMVKECFIQSDDFSKEPLAAVNSINWGRIMGQIVYYFWTYFRFIEEKGEFMNFCVPSGNFGNILAGFYARRMGLPIGKLIAATNENNILDRFFKENDYTRKPTRKTNTPSMDISISSNFERLLYYLYDRDASAVNDLMVKFKETNELFVTEEAFEKAQRWFTSATCDNTQTVETVKDIYDEHGYLADPHTATGIYAVKDSEDKVIILATAHPAKFPETVMGAVGVDPELPPHLADLMEREEKAVELPSSLSAVKDYIKSVQ